MAGTSVGPRLLPWNSSSRLFSSLAALQASKSTVTTQALWKDGGWAAVETPKPTMFLEKFTSSWTKKTLSSPPDMSTQLTAQQTTLQGVSSPPNTSSSLPSISPMNSNSSSSTSTPPLHPAGKLMLEVFLQCQNPSCRTTNNNGGRKQTPSQMNNLIQQCKCLCLTEALDRPPAPRKHALLTQALF